MGGAICHREGPARLPLRGPVVMGGGIIGHWGGGASECAAKQTASGHFHW